MADMQKTDLFKRFVLGLLVFVVAIVWFIPGQLMVALGLVLMIEGSALWLFPLFAPRPKLDEWS